MWLLWWLLGPVLLERPKIVLWDYLREHFHFGAVKSFLASVNNRLTTSTVLFQQSFCKIRKLLCTSLYSCSFLVFFRGFSFVLYSHFILSEPLHFYQTNVWCFFSNTRRTLFGDAIERRFHLFLCVITLNVFYSIHHFLYNGILFQRDQLPFLWNCNRL